MTEMRISLSSLAHRINEEHSAARGSIERGIKHAIATGELLIEAKKSVGHGRWIEWLETNCDVSARSAQTYMRRPPVP